ncbi:MAG: VOC family protein [Proteobacteria bacterium]|nr:VOC family protein [Pseudomonadota bacterium]
MPRFTFVDISADDPQRAIKFYQDVFGWTIEKWEGPMDYWLIKTGDPGEAGVDAGLARREDPSQFMTPVIDVPSAEDFAARVTASGGTIIQPKMTIPGVGYLVSCKDTEGNTFSIMQSEESAK